jgi:hypothetical protein
MIGLGRAPYLRYMVISPIKFSSSTPLLLGDMLYISSLQYPLDPSRYLLPMARMQKEMYLTLQFPHDPRGQGRILGSAPSRLLESHGEPEYSYPFTIEVMGVIKVMMAV